MMSLCCSYSGPEMRGREMEGAIVKTSGVVETSAGARRVPVRRALFSSSPGFPHCFALGTGPYPTNCIHFHRLEMLSLFSFRLFVTSLFLTAFVVVTVFFKIFFMFKIIQSIHRNIRAATFQTCALGNKTMANGKNYAQ